MRTMKFFAFATLAYLTSLHAGELPLSTSARLLQLISKGAGEGGKVACKNSAMAAEITKLGSEVSPSGRIAWAVNPEEIRMLAMQSKCVIGNDPRTLTFGAAIAIFEDNGKAKIAINAKALNASGITLSDAVIKAAVSQ